MDGKEEKIRNLHNGSGLMLTMFPMIDVPCHFAKTSLVTLGLLKETKAIPRCFLVLGW